MTFSSFLKGRTENLVTFVGGEQKIFMNLSPIPGSPWWQKNDTSRIIIRKVLTRTIQKCKFY